MVDTSFVDKLKKVKENYADQSTRQTLQTNEFDFTKVNPRKFTNNAVDFDTEKIEEPDPLFPKIRLIRRYCSQNDLQAIIPPHTETQTITELYKQVTPPDFKRPIDSMPNFILFGIVATRSVTRSSSRGTKFVTLLLSDLKYDISLALHGKAHENFWKVRPGTLLALLNPQFYVQKFDNSARTLAISISKERCIVEVGQAKDLGQCEAMTSSSQNSRRCKNWVDVRKSHVCEFHVEQKVTKTKRPEFNATSAKLWDPRGESKSSNGGRGNTPGKRLTVYEGGEVSWKRGLQVDSQANFGRSGDSFKKPFGFGGFPDAPIGRVFHSGTDLPSKKNDLSKYEASMEDKRRKQISDKRMLERITDDANLKNKLLAASKTSLNIPPSKVTKPIERASTSPRVFHKSQLRKLGFNPASLIASPKPINSDHLKSLKPSQERINTNLGQSDSDSDLEIV